MGRRPTFTEGDVAQAGLRVVRRQGWASVSLASVATDLGVTPMALYRVVSDADELRRLIANTPGLRLQPHFQATALVDALHTWAVDAHHELARLPGLTTYVLHEWTELPAWLTIVESFLAHADADGLTGQPAVATVNAVFAYVLARSQLREGVTKQRRLQPLRDEPDRYPHIRAQRHEFQTARTDKAFRFGLDALCAGLRDGTR
jgi:AcrR family transcriptional regulator